MDDFLARMASASRDRVRDAQKRVSEAKLVQAAARQPVPRIPSFREPGFDVIAEVKKQAPSAGRLCEIGAATDFVAAQARAYAQGGAAAISVLTEPAAFAGALADLRVAAAAVSAPILRKDFLVDPYQVLEARAMGASGVLLIAALLQPVMLRALLDVARMTDMFVLLELFDDRELPLAFEAREFASKHCSHLLLGVNARDLATLQIDTTRFARFAEQLPEDLPWIAESGIDSVETVRRVAGLGYRGTLVGTALMRSDDPTAMVAQFVAAGRAEAAR
jgi:indole-3-glycerol phosphate synthase